MKIIERRDSYIFVYYDEKNDVNSLITLMEEIAEACKKENIRKVLGDLSNMTGEPNFIDRFKLGIAGVKLLRGLAKIAIIYKQVESNRFAENVAVNRGLPTLITHDIEQAKRWLEND